MAVPRCPRCNCKGERAGQLYRCKSCGGFFDDDPGEGGDYTLRPSGRMEREERRRENRRFGRR